MIFQNGKKTLQQKWIWRLLLILYCCRIMWWRKKNDADHNDHRNARRPWKRWRQWRWLCWSSGVNECNDIDIKRLSAKFLLVLDSSKVIQNWCLLDYEINYSSAYFVKFICNPTMKCLVRQWIEYRTWYDKRFFVHPSVRLLHRKCQLCRNFNRNETPRQMYPQQMHGPAVGSLGWSGFFWVNVLKKGFAVVLIWFTRARRR